jgi:altronate hydrolase
MMRGYFRHDGRKGIRNHVVVAYLVECAHHVAREITIPYRDRGAHLIGFPGCYANDYAARMMERLCTHPNVGAVLLVSLGCENFDRKRLEKAVCASGRPVKTIVIQETGGTRPSLDEGRRWVKGILDSLASTSTVPMDVSELTVGTICGGSDSFSGITANPAVGKAFDLLAEKGARIIFEETGELIGCELRMKSRATTSEVAAAIDAAMIKAAHYYEVLGHSSFAQGNAAGGLTTIEEKSLGAYAKSGSGPIRGVIKPGDVPTESGIYLLDVIPDGEVRFGFPNINDNAEIAELIACGSHAILFTTGRGSVAGSAISPVVKICANPVTYRRMREDMDINAGRIVEDDVSLDEMGQEICDKVEAVASGEPTCSESLGHQEFILTYKTFEPSGPACFPGAGAAPLATPSK